MSKVTSEISVSLDGFVTGPNVGASNPLGDEGERLHDWMFSEKTEADAEILEEVYATTGAILLGRRMFDVGVEPWGDPPLFRIPVFVLTHETRDPLPKQGGTTYNFTAVLWLNGFEGMDIRCVRLVPYELDDKVSRRRPEIIAIRLAQWGIPQRSLISLKRSATTRVSSVISIPDQKLSCAARQSATDSKPSPSSCANCMVI